MITIAGVVFSMTLVALSLASSQFGPRLLRNFMRDTTNQVVLGTFVATFLYCLLVLRTIRRADEVAFVPHLSVTLGVLFALAQPRRADLLHPPRRRSPSRPTRSSRASARSCRGDRAPVSRRDRPTEPRRRRARDARALPEPFDREARPVRAGRRRLPAAHRCRRADGAGGGRRIASSGWSAGPATTSSRQRRSVIVWPGERVPTRSRAQRERRLRARQPAHRRAGHRVRRSTNSSRSRCARCRPASTIRSRRSRASTDWARRCAGWRSATCRRPIATTSRTGCGWSRRRITFPGIADAAFNQIRQYARSSAAVTIRLLETIAVIAAAAHRPEDRAALRRHADMIVRGAREGLPEAEDRRAVEERYQASLRVLGSGFPDRLQLKASQSRDQ